jgi:biopolymer transport protein ExbD
MSFGRPRRRPRLAELSLTPLIDVVFNLLVFFMLSASISQQATLQVELPRADVEPRPADPSAVVVVIDAAGVLHHKDTRVDLDQLTARLRHDRRQNPGATLVISADGDSAHRHLVTVLRAGRRAGFEEVNVAVQPDERAADADDAAPSQP